MNFIDAINKCNTIEELLKVTEGCGNLEGRKVKKLGYQGSVKIDFIQDKFNELLILDKETQKVPEMAIRLMNWGKELRQTEQDDKLTREKYKQFNDLISLANKFLKGESVYLPMAEQYESTGAKENFIRSKLMLELNKAIRQISKEEALSQSENRLKNELAAILYKIKQQDYRSDNPAEVANFPHRKLEIAETIKESPFEDFEDDGTLKENLEAIVILLKQNSLNEDQENELLVLYSKARLQSHDDLEDISYDVQKKYPAIYALVNSHIIHQKAKEILLHKSLSSDQVNLLNFYINEIYNSEFITPEELNELSLLISNHPHLENDFL